MPIEQARWNQANIDTLFYAGNQSFINRNFNFNSGGMSSQQYYFNICQQPINMVTGYERQHRKGINYQAIDGSDPRTTDQYTKLIMNSCQKEGINERFSKSCEFSAVAGLNLMQPYLDFTGDDPAQGQLKLKVWEYNSFLVDPFFVILICPTVNSFGVKNTSVSKKLKCDSPAKLIILALCMELLNVMGRFIFSQRITTWLAMI